MALLAPADCRRVQRAGGRIGEKPQKICRLEHRTRGCGDGCPGRPVGRNTPVPGYKKRFGNSASIKKITVDTSHLPPKPLETTSLPGLRPGREPGLPIFDILQPVRETKVVAPEEVRQFLLHRDMAMAPDFSGRRTAKAGPIEHIIYSIELRFRISRPARKQRRQVPEPEKLPRENHRLRPRPRSPR